MNLPMPTVVLRNAEIINEGRRLRADVLLRDGRIERFAPRDDFRAGFDPAR